MLIQPYVGTVGILFFSIATAMFPTQAAAQPSNFPFDAQLTKPLGFRQQPGLNAPHVLPNLNYLQPPTRVRVIGATGPLWGPGTFCKVEYASKQGFIRCDDPTAVKILTADPNIPTTVSPAVGGARQSAGSCTATSTVVAGVGTKFCRDVESCKKFCSCACRLDVSKWRPTADRSGNDGATTCPGSPTTGVGIIPKESTESVRIAAPNLRIVKASEHVRATKETIEALMRLDAYLAASPSRAQYNYTVKVRNCWRPVVEEVEKVCNFVLKAMHVIKVKPPNDPKVKEWRPKLNPLNVQLGFPGAGGHMAGQACDMVLVDSKGRDSFDSKVEGDSPRSSIPQRLALRMLDEAVTNDVVGGRRLNYEAWHYEWGTSNRCRCKHPECDQKWYPPEGKLNCE